METITLKKLESIINIQKFNQCIILKCKCLHSYVDINFTQLKETNTKIVLRQAMYAFYEKNWLAQTNQIQSQKIEHKEVFESEIILPNQCCIDGESMEVRWLTDISLSCKVYRQNCS